MFPVKIQREWLLLIGSLLVIAALYNHYIGHSVYLAEIVLVVVGTLIALYALATQTSKSVDAQEGMLVDFLSRFLTKKQCALLLPLVGFVLILGWSTWKLSVRGTADLRMEDFMVTVLGLSLILYYSGPSRFTQQKDFVVLYLIFMTFVFVVFWRSYVLLTGDAGAELSSYTRYYLITVPVVILVQLLGVDANALLQINNSGITNFIEYEYHGRFISLGIGATCSGLYSAGLFFSAFLAFILVRYRKIDRYTLAGLGVGFLVTWCSNIFRMTITVLVGSIYGHPALSVFHSYFGIIVFIISLTIFWMLIVRWLDRHESAHMPAEVMNKDIPA